MAVDKRWRLVCYDVRDEKRYRRVFKIVKGSGEPVQYSIFRCRLDDLETERLRWRLAQVMAQEDRLLIADLCPRCAGNVIVRNHLEGWSDAPSGFRILGGDRHASPRGRQQKAPAAAEPPKSSEENDD